MESVIKAKAEIFARPEASRSQDSKKKKSFRRIYSQSWDLELNYSDMSYHE